jgi:hypothetical protein
MVTICTTRLSKNGEETVTSINILIYNLFILNVGHNSGDGVRGTIKAKGLWFI